MSTHRFTNLGTVIDDVHALLDAWMDEGSLQPPLNHDGEIVLRLAVHEWIANLVQHASFLSSEPEIWLDVQRNPDAVTVSIEDTSRGFDLLGQLEEQHELLHAPAPSERGRGLLMLITCTDDLNYCPAGENRQQLSFTLKNPDEAIFAGLFYPDVQSAASPAPFLHEEAHLGGDGLTSLPLTPQPDSR